MSDRSEMIETEINVLRLIYQSPSVTSSQRSLIIEHTARLVAEQRAIGQSKEARQEAGSNATG